MSHFIFRFMWSSEDVLFSLRSCQNSVVGSRVPARGPYFASWFWLALTTCVWAGNELAPEPGTTVALQVFSTTWHWQKLYIFVGLERLWCNLLEFDGVFFVNGICVVWLTVMFAVRKNNYIHILNFRHFLLTLDWFNYWSRSKLLSCYSLLCLWHF